MLLLGERLDTLSLTVAAFSNLLGSPPKTNILYLYTSLFAFFIFSPFQFPKLITIILFFITVLPPIQNTSTLQPCPKYKINKNKKPN